MNICICVCTEGESKRARLTERIKWCKVKAVGQTRKGYMSTCMYYSCNFSVRLKKIKTKVYKKIFLNVEGKRVSKMENSQDESGEADKTQVIEHSVACGLGLDFTPATIERH